MTATVTPPRDVQTFRPEPISHRAAGERSPATGFLALLPALVVAAVTGYGAGDRALAPAEFATLHAAGLPWPDLGRLLTHTDLGHGLYYAFMHAWLAVAGDSALMLRVPGIAAAAITALITALIGRRLISTPAGVVAGLLLALTPSLTGYAQQARPPALVTMLTVLATYFLLRAVHRPTWWRWSLYTVPFALAGLLFVPAMALLVPHAIGVRLATTAGDETRRWRFAGAAGAAVLLVLPLPALLTDQADLPSWLTGPAASLPGDLFLATTFGSAMIGLALLGALLLWRRHRPGAGLLLAWAVLPVPVVVLLAGPVGGLLLAVPPIAVLAAGAIVYLFRPLGVRPHGAVWLLSAALALPGMAYLALDDQRAVRETPAVSYAAALSWVREKAKRGDGIVYNDPGARLAAGAIAGPSAGAGPKDVLLARTATELGAYSAVECPDAAPCLSGSKRLWLIAPAGKKAPWDGLTPAAAAILGHDFAVTGKKSVPGLTVTLLTRKPAGS